MGLEEDNPDCVADRLEDIHLMDWALVQHLFERYYLWLHLRCWREDAGVVNPDSQICDKAHETES